MADFEELRLQVTLVDNASAGIAKLRTELAQLGLGSTAGSRLRRNNEDMANSFRFLGLSAQQSARLVSFGAGVMTGSLMQIGHEMGRAIKMLPEWSEKMRAAGIAAQSVGASAGQYEYVVRKMQEYGMTAEAAAKSVHGLADYRQQL